MERTGQEMKLPRIVQNALMAALNGAAVLAIVMLIAWLLWFVVLAVVQSIPDEDD
jgi:hypothetical protein